MPRKPHGHQTGAQVLMENLETEVVTSFLLPRTLGAGEEAWFTTRKEVNIGEGVVFSVEIITGQIELTDYAYSKRRCLDKHMLIIIK